MAIISLQTWPKSFETFSANFAQSYSGHVQRFNDILKKFTAETLRSSAALDAKNSSKTEAI